MKKLIFLFKILILSINGIKYFEIYSFATESSESKLIISELPELVQDLIARNFIHEFIVDYKKDAHQKTRIRCNVTKLACVNQLFYILILNIIDKTPDYWDYFEVIIDESSENRKFDQVISRCNAHLEERREKKLGENQIFPPLLLCSICFDVVNFGSEHVYQLEKTLASYFTNLKRFRFIGMRILPEVSLLSFQNALKNFDHLTAIDAQEKSIMMPIEEGLPFLYRSRIHIPEKLFLALEESFFLHYRLQSLTLNFNCQISGLQKRIMIEHSLITNRPAIELITSDRLFNMILKFSNLKKIGLIGADLRQVDSLKLKLVLFKFSKKLEYLDLSENEYINHSFLLEIFSSLDYNVLKVLNLSMTNYNQDCWDFPQFKNITRLIT